MRKTKKIVSVGMAYARANYSQINGEKKNRNIAYFKLKQSLIYPELCNAFDFLTKNIHKTRTELLIGNQLCEV